MSYTPPTVSEIREVSNMVFSEYGYAEPGEGDTDPLVPLLADAQAELKATVRFHLDVPLLFDKIDVTTEVGQMVETLLNKALRMWVEWLVVSSQAEIVDTAGDIDIHASSGGSRSASRRMLSSNLQMWHVWPALDRIIQFLMKVYTEEVAPGELPSDVPAVSNPGVLPRPGEFVMGRRRLLNSPFDMPAIGVANILSGGRG